MPEIEDSNASAPVGAFGVAQFCKTYGISRSLAYVELAAGRLQARKAANRTLILRSEAERWARALPAMVSHA